MSNGTKQEMTGEEFCKLWALTEKYDVNDPTHNKLIEICLSDLRSVIRGKLIEFKKLHNKEYGGVILVSEIDEFLSNNQ